MPALTTPGGGLAAAVLLIVFCVAAVYKATAARRPLRSLFRVLTAGRVDPGASSNGPAWVSGTVVSGDHTLTAPLSRTECVAYTISGETLEDGHRRKYWEDFTGRTLIAPFYLDGIAGQTLVSPTGLGARAVRRGRGEDEPARVDSEMALDWDDADYRSSEDVFDLDRTVEFLVDEGDDLPPEVERAITAETGLSRPPDQRTVRFREWTVEPAMTVHVLGSVDASDGPVPRLTDEDWLVVTDSPPGETARKLAALASRHLSLAALFLFLVWISLGAFGIPTGSSFVTVSVVLFGAMVLFGGASILGRAMAFPPGEYRRRRRKRFAVASTLSIVLAAAGFLLTTGPIATVSPRFALIVAMPYVPLAFVVGALAYAVLHAIGWP